MTCCCALQANGAPQAATIERLERDASALTDEQRLSAVMADAPELAALLSELQGSLAEVRSHVGPVLQEVIFAAPLYMSQCCTELAKHAHCKACVGYYFHHACHLPTCVVNRQKRQSAAVACYALLPGSIA